MKALAIEDLDFTDSTTRESYGGRKRVRRLLSGFPTSRLRSRLLAMAAEVGVAVIAVDPAYTSRCGAEHWQVPTSTSDHKTTRHEAAAIAIGRRALGHGIRRRKAPPRQHQWDVAGHRTLHAGSRAVDAREPATPDPEHGHRSEPPARATYAGDQATQHRSGSSGDQSLALFAAQERFDPLFALSRRPC